MAKATLAGAETVAKNLKSVQKRFLNEVNADMERVRKLLDERIGRNISLSDHSLSDLADLGHPYAARAPQAIHQPDYQVHVQSGKMLASKHSGVKPASVSAGKLTATAYAGVSDQVEHALYVVLGTSKMIPRDFLTGSLNEVKDQTINILRRSLKNTTVNFNGEKTKL